MFSASLIKTFPSFRPLLTVNGHSCVSAEQLSKGSKVVAIQHAPVVPPVLNPGVVDLVLVMVVRVVEVTVVTVARRRSLRDVALPFLESELYQGALHVRFVQSQYVVFHYRHCHTAPNAHGSV